MSRSYQTVGELIELIDEPNRRACRQVFKENAELFRSAPGSSHNHQAWRGGYYDHVSEVMNLAVLFYNALGTARPLSFSLSDALLVVFLHDLEKPWKYVVGFDGSITKDAGMTKEGRKSFRAQKIHEYGIDLTPEHENALRYVEGIPDSEYTPGARIMGPLAAFCHLCDVTSARIWFDYPQTIHDSWQGAKRST